MRTVKPQRLGMLTRPFEVSGASYLAVTVAGFFSFDAPDALRPEVELWTFIAAALGGDAVLDAAMPKSQSEVLVCGSAWSLRAPSAAVDIALRVGAVEKRLRVVGDRRWERDTLSVPTPFTEMPVVWSRAFGRPGYAQNPVGTGLPQGSGPRPAPPNIEDPARMIARPTDRPAPAGLLPLDAMHPLRLGRSGTYDDAWLRERFPGLPDDVDWTCFCVAPPDQRLPGFFRGDEDFTVIGMHPTRANVGGRLPALVARAFVTKQTPAGERFEEIAMRPETLWLFPSAERAVLLWRGVTPVRDDDAHDVRDLLIAADRADAPRPLQHYRDVLTERRDPERGALAALNDAPLVPDGDADASAPSDEMRAAEARLTQGDHQEQNLRARMRAEQDTLRARMIADGVDPSQIPEPPQEEALPSMADLPAFIAEMERRAEAQKVDAEARQKQAMEDLRRACVEEGIDPDGAMRGAQGGPPKFSAETELAGLAALAAESRAAGAPSTDLEAMIADPEFAQRLRDMEARLRDVYARGAQHLPPAARLDDETNARVRASVEEARAAGASLRESDLTGADLSGMDLSGMDLSAVLLEGADLRGARLEGATLDGAVLVRAQLEGTNLRGAKLREANLAQANARRADLTGADLTNAELTETDLTGAVLRGAVLRDATLAETVLLEADLGEVDATELLVNEVSLSGVSLRGARLADATFIKCDLRGTDLSGADLTNASLLDVRAAGIVLRDVRAAGMRVALRSDLTAAVLAGATLDGANLRETVMPRADLERASLRGADFSECDLTAARLHRVFARSARFERAVLLGADLREADLLGAMLPRADLRGVDATGANLFRADLARVRIDRDTRFSGALLDDARVVQRREPS